MFRSCNLLETLAPHGATCDERTLASERISGRALRDFSIHRRHGLGNHLARQPYHEGCAAHGAGFSSDGATEEFDVPATQIQSQPRTFALGRPREGLKQVRVVSSNSWTVVVDQESHSVTAGFEPRVEANLPRARLG